jgi:hypothetical protein
MRAELVGGPADGSILTDWPESESIQIPIPSGNDVAFHHYRRTSVVREDGTRLYVYVGTLGAASG